MKTERINLRVTPDLKKKLNKLAKLENRDLSNYIETLLIEHVKNRTGRADKS